MSPPFAPFFRARILGVEASLPSRRLMEAVEIRDRKPAVNGDAGWRLTDFLRPAVH
jgi:hypothetical protein